MILSTERLILRTPELEDAPRILHYYQSNREHFTPWDPARAESFYTLAFWRRQLGMTLEEIDAGRLLQFFFFEREYSAGSLDPGSGSNEIVGHASFSNIVRGPLQAATLGYALAADAVGKGYMQEALREAIRYCFEELGLHRIAANYIPRNDRSARLLECLGFEREGLARKYLRIAGRWEDHVLTSLTNPDWRDPREG